MEILKQQPAGISPASQSGNSSHKGVYAVSGVKDGGLYIGASTNLPRRRREHFAALESGRHFNGHLQGAYERFGRNSFVFLVLKETDDPADLSRYEQENINHYSRSGHLYNIVLAVPKVRPGGHHLTDETRRKQSVAKRGAKNAAFGKKKRIEETRALLYRFLNPKGEVVECFGLPSLCKEHGLNQSHMSKVARGILKQHHGWRAAP
jgi:group I intron endonuclease